MEERTLLTLMVFSSLVVLAETIAQKDAIEIYSLHVDCKVTSRFAHTIITSKIVNRANESREATFEVELPKSAFITNFSMSIDGKVYPGIIKEKASAQKEYDAAVSHGQSAGLVKITGRKLEQFHVSVSIAAASKVTFELAYEELLKRQLGKFELLIKVRPKQLVKHFQIDVHIFEPQGIRFLETDSTFMTNELTEALTKVQNETKAHILFKPTVDQQKINPELDETLLNGDFVVRYDVKRGATAGDIQIVNGYFVHYFAPREMPVFPKNVIFVIDRSGSMAGRKIEQTRDALLKILQDLRPEDQFSFITFNSKVAEWKSSLLQATADNVASAAGFVQTLSASGGTDINRALLTAVSMLDKAERLPGRSVSMMILLTDGQPTSGESESSLSRFAHRLSVKQKQEKRRKAEYASAELSAFRPRSLSIEWSTSPKMTQQMRDLQLAQARKPPGPSSPNAAKRLYRNLSGKFRVNYTSFDEGSLAGRGEKEKLRKSYLFQSNAALFEAVELQDLDRVQELLKQYSPEELDLNTPNSEGLLPLDIAIMTNNAPIARALLQAGGKESPHFVSLESRSLHLSTLVREAEQRVNELTAQVVNEAPNTDCSEKEKQLKAWEWRYRLYKRMKAGFEHARVPDAPTNVHLSVASSSSVQVTFWEPLSVNSAVVTKYKVEWSCSPTFSPRLGEAVIDKLKNLHFTIRGLVSGTAYYVQVSAYNMKGWGPPQASVPPFAIPSNWREYDGRAPRRRGQAEALDHLLGQVKTVHQHCVCHEPCKNQPQSRKHSVSKSLKHLFHPGSKFLKTLKRGLYLTAIFYKDDNILVTHEDQIPVVEIDDTYSCLLMQDFLWFTKVSCMWDEILWLRQCVTVSQSSCSCILQTRFKMLLAISQMQGLLGIQDLGQVFFEPVKDKQGNILIVTLKEVKTNQTFESVRWVPICKLQTSRKSVSSPEEPTALDTLLISIQDKLAYHQRSSHALSPGLYLGYLKLCSAVDQIRVLVPERLPNILCHVKIRSNPNISREEWEWLQKMASVEEPIPAEPEAENSQNHLFQELQVAIKELMTLVNIPLQEAKDFRLYSQEVLDFGGQVSFLLLLPPSDDVCTAPGQNNPYTPRSGFLTLPLQIFELVHFFTYDREFITQYCQVSALLELESLLSQQSLREAFSDAELSTAKQRHQQVQDYIQQMEEIWREMRWIMDALQHARYKQPSCGVSLSGFLSEAGSAMKEKTQSTSSHLEYLPSPAPSPETSRKLNSDLHGLSDEEGSSEVFLATDSDYDSSRAQSPKELDLVYSSSGPECCSRRVARTLRDSAPDVLQTHELKTPPLPPPPPEEPRPPPELYDSDFVLPSRQIELLRITEKRQAYCVRTSSLDFPKPRCQAARKSCPGSVDSSPTESRTAGHCGQLRLGTGSTPSPEHGRGRQGSEPVFRTRSAEWTQSFQEQPEQPGCLADQGKKPGSITLRVCPQYETGLSKETSVKLHITSQTSAGEVVKLVVLEMNDVSRGMLGGSAAFCYGEEQLEHFGLVFASDESERWLPDDFLPLSLQTTRPEGRFYVRIKETSPLVLQYGPATTV